MKDEITIILNGIMTQSEDPAGWVDVASRYLRTEHHVFCEKLEYTTGFLFTRAAFHKTRVENLHVFINYYIRKKWKVNLIGHSYGCHIITDSIKGYSAGGIGDVSLIAGATEKDFGKNGLNEALQNEIVDKVMIFKSDGDKVLRKAAGLSQKLFGWIGKGRLSYGQLGLYGPKNVADDVRDKVRVIDSQELFGFNVDHSGWVKNNELQKTMNFIFSP